MADPTGAPEAAAAAPLLPPPAPGDLVPTGPAPGAALPGTVPTAEPPHEHLAEPQQRVVQPPRPVPWGGGALVLAMLMVVTVVVALVVDAPGRYLAATILAVAADVLSILAVVLGIVGIATRRARGAGIAALVIAVLGNPLVLLYGLGVLT